MSFLIRFTDDAATDLARLYEFSARNEPGAATRAIETIDKAWELLEEFPFSCRKIDDLNPSLRELIIPFGASGYIALFEIENDAVVTVLAVRHQRENDYH